MLTAFCLSLGHWCGVLGFAFWILWICLHFVIVCRRAVFGSLLWTSLTFPRNEPRGSVAAMDLRSDVDAPTSCPPFRTVSLPRQSPFGRAWFLWAFLVLACRVGEAKKPGPDWTVSVANFNGLNGKAFGFADSSYDVWLFSETHLTLPGLKTFWGNVRSVNQNYRAFQHGCPVAPRSETSDIGQWSGVGIMATFPVRRLPHDWSVGAYHSGRLLCTSFCAHGIWVSGVQVYGTPTGPTHPNGKEVTNQLLAQALERIEQQPGPRYIAGDFNHDLDQLATVSVLTRLGYRDLQDLEAERSGRLPVATCRGKTRRDFMLVSRERAALFLECKVDDDLLQITPTLWVGSEVVLMSCVGLLGPSLIQWNGNHCLDASHSSVIFSGCLTV